MFIYTNKNNEVITVSEKDILSKGSYTNKYEISNNKRIPKNLHLYIFDGSKFILKPNAIDAIKQSKQKELLDRENQRLQNILDRYGYISLADVQLYVSQNDTEAKVLLDWYQIYDDEIWNWINNDLQAFTTVDNLLALDMKAVEEQIYQNSVITSPLP